MQTTANLPRIVIDIPQNHVKVINRTVHCLAKVNEEFFIEPSSTGVVFRAINGTRTAHVAVTFQRSFFSQLMVEDDVSGLTAHEINLRFTARYFMAAFRNIALLTTVRMEVPQGGDQMVVHANTAHEGIVKRFCFPFAQEVSDKAGEQHLTGCRFRAKPNQIADAIASFHPKSENLQLAPAEQRLAIMSDESPGSSSGYGGTSISLNVTDLLTYELDTRSNLETSITGPKVFEQRYLRAFLGLADGCGLEAQVSFDGDRAPISLEADSVDMDPTTRTPEYRVAMLVTAYTADPPEEQPQPPLQPQQQPQMPPPRLETPPVAPAQPPQGPDSIQSWRTATGPRVQETPMAGADSIRSWRTATGAPPPEASSPPPPVQQQVHHQPVGPVQQQQPVQHQIQPELQPFPQQQGQQQPMQQHPLPQQPMQLMRPVQQHPIQQQPVQPPQPMQQLQHQQMGQQRVQQQQIRQQPPQPMQQLQHQQMGQQQIGQQPPQPMQQLQHQQMQGQQQTPSPQAGQHLFESPAGTVVPGTPMLPGSVRTPSPEPKRPKFSNETPEKDDDSAIRAVLNSWQPERYLSQLEVSQFDSQRIDPYLPAQEEEEVLAPSVSPPRYE